MSEQTQRQAEWIDLVLRDPASAGIFYATQESKDEAEGQLRAVRADRERLLEAVREDPEKWSFWTLVKIAELILAADYPPDVFNGSSGDPGPVFVTALRDALAALAASSAPGDGGTVQAPIDQSYYGPHRTEPARDG